MEFRRVLFRSLKLMLDYCVNEKHFENIWADPLTDFLQEVKERAHYHYWLFGHYHDNRAIDEKHILLWDQIIQVI